MLKKSLSLLLAWIIAFSAVLIVPFSALDNGGSIVSTGADLTYGDFTYSVLGSDATITGYTGAGGYVRIPASVNGYPVKTIGSGAFKSKATITGLFIPSSVTTIGSSSFEGCNGLTQVDIPSSVKKLGAAAFYGCEGMTELKIGGGVESMDYEENFTYSYGPFSYCTALKTVTIASGTTTIGRFAFKGCTSLTSVTIPDSVTEVCKGSFENCTSLSGVTIPDKVTYIGTSAFEGCAAMTYVNIGKSVTAINEYAFSECVNIKKVSIPDSVKSLGTCAFYGCSAMTELYIGSGVERMDSFENFTSSGGAFTNCTALKTVTIASGTTTIGKFAFKGCSSLTSVMIPDSVTEVCKGSFENCTSLSGVTIPDKVTYIGTSAFEGCAAMTYVNIGKSVTAINEYAFSECVNIKKVSIPDSVKSLGTCAFYGCSAMTELYIGSGVERMDSFESFTSSGGAFTSCTALKYVSIASGTTVIGKYAFQGCTSLTDIDIPDSVIQMGSVKLTSTSYKDEWLFKNHPDSLKIHYHSTDSLAYKFALDNGIGYTTERMPNVVVLPTKLTLNTHSVTREVGLTYQLKATITPSDATDQTVTWWTSNYSVAEVSSTGLVKAKAKGKATITAKTSNGCYDTCTVEVIIKPDLIMIDSELKLKEGETGVINAAVYPTDANDRSLTWTSAQPGIATVDKNGTVTAIKAGETEVTAKTSNNVTAKCRIVVEAKTYSEKYGWCLTNNEESYGYDKLEHDEKGRLIHPISDDSYKDVFGSSIPDSIYRKISQSIYSVWGGYCFGLSLLSLGEYYGKIDLSNYFSKDGTYLYDYGYESIYTKSSGKQCFSIENNPNAIRVIENAQLMQYSSEFKDCEVFKGRSGVTELIDYLNTDDAQPLMLSVVEPGAVNRDAHTMVITADSKPKEVKVNDETGWYSIEVYDPNAPAPSKLLTNPMSYYDRGQSYLLLSPEHNKWIYWLNGKEQMGAKIYSIENSTMDKCKSIWFYDVSKLSDSIFNSRISLPVYQTVIQFSGDDLTITDSEDNVITMIKGGEVVILNEDIDCYAYTGSADDDNSGNTYLFYADSQKYRVKSADSELLFLNANYTFMTQMDGSCSLTYDPSRGAASAVGLNSGGRIDLTLQDNRTEKCVSASNDAYRDERISITLDTENAEMIVTTNDTGVLIEAENTSNQELIVNYLRLYLGDVDLSGQIELPDATAIQYHLANMYEFTEKHDALADTDGDGEAGITDATLILRYLAGMIGGFRNVESVTLNKDELTLTEGDTEVLAAVIKPDFVDGAIRWKSDNEAVATVADGKVTGVAAGTATITATARGGLTATCTVTVKAIEILPEKVTLDVPELTLAPGESTTLNAVVLPENATDKSVTWEVDNSNAVSVSQDGTITALSCGKAFVQVTTVNGRFAFCLVTVKDPWEDYIKLYTASDLYNIRNNTSGKYVMMNDISLNAYADWTPISSFSGELNGNGYTISGMSIVRENINLYFYDVDEANYGLFMSAQNASFKDFTLKGTISLSFSGDAISFTGGVVGGVDSGDLLFENVSVDCNITVNSLSLAHVGGLCGSADRSKYIGCTFKGKINVTTTGIGTNCGGMCGHAGASYNCIFDHCVNTGTITAVRKTDVQYNESDLRQMYSYIKVGGLAGYVEARNTITYSDCSSTGMITAYMYNAKIEKASTLHAGGLVGQDTDAQNSVLTNCSSTRYPLCYMEKTTGDNVLQYSSYIGNS